MNRSGVEVEIDGLRKDAKTLKHAHLDASRKTEKKHLQLGLPVVVINIIVGSVFLSEFNDFKNYLVPSLSLVAALLAGLQTYLNLHKKVTLHHTVGNLYSDIERSSQQLLGKLADNLMNMEQAWGDLEKLTQAYSATNKKAEECPLTQSQLSSALKLADHLDSPANKRVN